MKMKEIRELTDAEIDLRLDELGRERLNMTIQARAGKLKDSSRLRLARRDVARIRTELTVRRTLASSSQGA